MASGTSGRTRRATRRRSARSRCRVASDLALPRRKADRFRLGAPLSSRYGVTVRDHARVLPSAVAEMNVVPAVSAVRVPAASIVATLGFELAQVTGRGVVKPELTSRKEADRLAVVPAFIGLLKEKSTE